jgi:hypothetical protein
VHKQTQKGHLHQLNSPFMNGWWPLRWKNAINDRRKVVWKDAGGFSAHTKQGEAGWQWLKCCGRQPGAHC